MTATPSKTGPDRFGRGERAVCSKTVHQGWDGPVLLEVGEAGTVVFREPLDNRELYHFAPDNPRTVFQNDMLLTPDYLEAEK